MRSEHITGRGPFARDAPQKPVQLAKPARQFQAVAALGVNVHEVVARPQEILQHARTCVSCAWLSIAGLGRYHWLLRTESRLARPSGLVTAERLPAVDVPLAKTCLVGEHRWWS